jgi:hypothetical protein
MTADAALLLQGTVVADADKRPLTVYHGSGAAIERFEYAFTNAGNDQLGSGFYFTSDIEQAKGYAVRRLEPELAKPGGEDAPNVVHAMLSIKNPLSSTFAGKGLSRVAVQKLLRRSPCLNEALENFGDVEFEGQEKVLNEAVAMYVTPPGAGKPLLKQLFKVANDFYPDHIAEFNKAVFEVLGYDGVVETFKDGTTHYVAFFPEQVVILLSEPVVDNNADRIQDAGDESQAPPSDRPA